MLVLISFDGILQGFKKLLLGCNKKMLRKNTERGNNSNGYLKSIRSDMNDIAHNLEQIANERERCKKDRTPICMVMIKKSYEQIILKIHRIDGSIRSIKTLDSERLGGGLSNMLNYSVKHGRPPLKNQIEEMAKKLREAVLFMSSNEVSYKERAMFAQSTMKTFVMFWRNVIIPDLMSKGLLLVDDAVEKDLQKEASNLLKEIQGQIDDERAFASSMMDLHPPRS